MQITVKDGVAIKIAGNPEHPTTAGALCTKVARYLERTYHDQRILHPLKRIGKKGAGRFERISWEQALHEISARLKTIAAEDPEQIVPYSYAGTMGLIQGESMSARFFHRLGAARLARTICAEAGSLAMRYTVGGSYGMDVEQFAHSKLIIFWGCNAVGSNLHLWALAQEAKRNGARLIAIDPYRSLTAEKCHQHIAPMPGTDAALALGMMHVLITENLLDHDYIAQYTLGFDALRERALHYPPEKAAALTGLDAPTIIALAREYAQSALRGEAAALRLNYGMQRVAGGGNAVRAIACLPALVGAWRQPAGGLLLSASGWFPVNHDALERPDLLAGRDPRTINMSTIGNDLLRADPPIKALIVYNANPVAVAPESGSVAQGFAREDLLTVVLEHFQTDTADYADYILPATTQLEHQDIHKSYGHWYALANNAAIAPLGEAKPNTEIFRRLAQTMGFTDPCFSETDEQLTQQAYDWNHPHMQGITPASLKEQGWQRLHLPADHAPFAHGNFPTPSGKCEFYSARLAALGLEPVPDHVPPHESAQSNPALAQRYPLSIISPPARNFLNSSFVNVESLRATEGEPHLEMHPIDATRRGISDGMLVKIENARGHFLARARVSDRARPGLVVALSIWWKKLASDHKNANEVTHQKLTDLGAAATFYDVLVEVSAAATSPPLQGEG